MSYPSDKPRCLAPMQYRSPSGDPDPVCWRPRGHEQRGGTRAAKRHLSRTAYLNELARGRRDKGRFR